MELVVIMLILAILLAVAIPSITNLGENARTKNTERELMELVRAFVGEPEVGFLGYIEEVGELPENAPVGGIAVATQLSPGLTALYKIWNASPYNPFTRTGWNGPYIDMKRKDIDGAEQIDVLYDDWGNEYQYDKAAATVSSDGPDGTNGSGDDIILQIQN